MGPIWLVGMMGAGKTTVAPLVAARLGREWIDADHAIESRAGRTVVELFAESEEAFRLAELDTIEVLADSDAVIAAGGGAVTTAAGRIMADSGFVVWLRADPQVLAGRVGGAVRGRPLLAEASVDRLASLAEEREEMYAAVADAVVETDDVIPGRVAELVVEAWQSAASEE